ncbi:MAG: hypothetical protein ACK532_12515 [Acidobacteriota bacterium]
MKVVLAIVTIVLPLAAGLFLLARAWLMTFRGKRHLARQGLLRAPDGVERLAGLYAVRDVLVGVSFISAPLVVLYLPRSLCMAVAGAMSAAALYQLLTYAGLVWIHHRA